MSSTPTVTVPLNCEFPAISIAPEISKVAASSSPDNVMLVAPVTAPFKATAPFTSKVVTLISTSVAVKSISSVAPIDNTVAEEP